MTHDQLAESLAKAIGEDAARKIGLLRAHPDRVAHELDRHAMQRSAKALESVYALIRSGAPPEAIQQDSGQITARAGGDAQVPDSGAAAQTRTGGLLITNHREPSPESAQEQALSEEQARAGVVEKGELDQGCGQTLQQPAETLEGWSLRMAALESGQEVRAGSALRSIGFRLDWRVLVCADYGDPTTRQRFFLIGRSDGKPLRWPEPTHARGGSMDLLGMRAPWRSAAECIDWSHPGKSIFGRKKPLKPNTLRRLLAGAVKYNWPQPHIDALQALLDGREPVLTVPAAELGAAFLVQFRGTGEAIERSARDCGDPVPTVTAGGRHVGLVMATASGGAARDLSEPLPTVVGGGNGARPHFVEAVVLGTNNSSRARSASEPFPTITTGGAGNPDRPGNARPAIVAPLIAPYYGGGSGLTAQSAAEPLASVTTKARFGLAEPVIVSTSNSSSQGTPRGAGEPLRTITTAKGGDMAVASPVATECRIDILYRMLTPRELARAMSFDVDGAEYPFAGNATEITKQIGNAVPCRTAEALVRALL